MLRRNKKTSTGLINLLFVALRLGVRDFLFLKPANSRIPRIAAGVRQAMYFWQHSAIIFSIKLKTKEKTKWLIE
jgi:hypothetical protein